MNVDQIIDKRTVAIPGPIGQVTPGMQQLHDEAQTYAAGTKALQDQAVSGLVADGGTATRRTLDARYGPPRIVVFGDSWTHLFDDYLPRTIATGMGGTLVRNYGVNGASLGTYYSETIDLQAAAANADAAVDRDAVTDVVVVCGVNNVGGVVVDVPTLAASFNKLRLYPHARYWYAANAKMSLNADAYALQRWYGYLFDAARLSGFHTLRYSPLWLLDERYRSYWDGDDLGQRHPNQSGMTAWCMKFLSSMYGQSATSANVEFTFDAAFAAKFPSPPSITQYAFALEGYRLEVKGRIVAAKRDTTNFTDVGMTLVGSIPQQFAPYISQTVTPSIVTQHQGWGDYNYTPRGGMTIDATGSVYLDAQLFRDHLGFIDISSTFKLV